MFNQGEEYMKFAASLALAAVAASVAAPASAQFAKPEDAIKYRQSALFVMGQHFGRIGAMVNGKAPYDAKAAADSAEIVSTVSHLPWAGFGPGTDKGRENRAKPEIWTNQAKFKEHSDKLMDATAKLATAAKTNSMDNLKPAFTSAAGTCKGCHDDFRKEQ
jgi:cytochrome c556